MRVLLSTIGSRGDVQPLVALAVELRALGQGVHLCVPPDFREWIAGLGFQVTPIGPELRTFAFSSSGTAVRPSPERLRQLVDESVAAQFSTVAAAAKGCDVIVAATAIQAAARSVAETMGIPYVFAAYCPAVLPSLHHAPPVLGLRGDTPAATAAGDRLELWARDAARFNDSFGPSLNARRAAIGLAPVSDVRSHIFTDQPWLAADATLGPWPEPADPRVLQTGAWILPDDRPLAPELEAFLDAGEPPVYFGFGSLRAPHSSSQVLIESARALGRRAIVLRGWADLSLVDDEPDCLAIGEANLQRLFTRVAVAVHHGGAGTTTTASRAGAPQVVMPQVYDQYYWAQQIDRLGIGVAHAPGAPTRESLTSALDQALRSEVANHARSVAGAIRSDGARVAAHRLMADTRVS